jgi:hypothetical protein
LKLLLHVVSPVQRLQATANENAVGSFWLMPVNSVWPSSIFSQNPYLFSKRRWRIIFFSEIMAIIIMS